MKLGDPGDQMMRDMEAMVEQTRPKIAAGVSCLLTFSCEMSRARFKDYSRVVYTRMGGKYDKRGQEWVFASGAVVRFQPVQDAVICAFGSGFEVWNKYTRG